jgi:hypothetical protein
MRTRADLVTEALDVLNIVPTGQPAEVEDYEKVDDKVDGMLARLAGLEIVYVGDANQIPDEWFDDLAAILAEACKAKFGVTADDAERLTRDGLGSPVGSGTAAMSLKMMTRGRPTGEPQETEYF